ncbi:hypothetical protein K0M31_010824, partial [Melipona bicolor]
MELSLELGERESRGFERSTSFNVRAKEIGAGYFLAGEQLRTNVEELANLHPLSIIFRANLADSLLLSIGARIGLGLVYCDCVKREIDEA